MKFKLYRIYNRHPSVTEAIGEVDNIKEFMKLRDGFNSYCMAQDEKGYKYFTDGTGIGFCACNVWYSELDSKPMVTNWKDFKGSRYSQEGISFYSLLRLAHDIRREFGSNEAYEYLKRLRTRRKKNV